MDSEGPRDTRHHPREEFAHDIHELGEDLAYERETLDESIKHDYSTSRAGIVPLNRRRPLWHFAGLWLTFFSGFSYLFLGFEIHDGGHSLASTIVITLIAAGIYLAYALFSAYLGSRTGQTHSLLTRSIFGVFGSWIVSLFIVVGALGWAGFQANLTAQIWDGLYGWGHVELLGILLAVVMVTNNVFGFTGVSVFARYVATPLVILWVIYLVIKGFAVDSSSLGGTPNVEGGLGFWPGVAVVLGFLAYGNEPDIFRYGKPRFWWPAAAYLFAFGGLLLCTMAGWMMAELARTADFAGLMKFTVHYSLFGVFWLAWLLVTVTQVAINDSNYYEAINAGQNVIGGWSRWRRFYTCAIAAGGAALAAWLVPYVITNGFFKLANFLAITVVSATVIMVVDHFLVPRIFGISRPLLYVPRWSETAMINWPAVIALLVAVAFGSYASGLLPGEDPSRFWGLPPVEAWAVAGVLYIAGVWVARAWAAEPRKVLGFSRLALAEPAPPGTVVDMASREEAVPALAGGRPKAEPVGRI
jgi:purine-cytosine permease-like protein